jgi:hypothetical protein
MRFYHSGTNSSIREGATFSKKTSENIFSHYWYLFECSTKYIHLRCATDTKLAFFSTYQFVYTPAQQFLSLFNRIWHMQGQTVWAMH